MLNPWAGIALVITALLGMMAILSIYRSKAMPHPEIPRKLVHLGMGLVTLSFPWMFGETWPVWVLVGISVPMLAMMKFKNPVQQRFGGVVSGVARHSYGDLYFPISVAIVFQFSIHRPILYFIPVLLLTLADAVAALIGVFYGKRQYVAAEGHKSTEGSIAFFTVAFLSTHVPLLLFTNTGRAESLLLGLIIGFLVMLIEAIAWKGLDNLLIPIGGFLLLSSYMRMDVPALVALLIATVLCVIFVFVSRKCSTLDDSALLGVALVIYLTWSMGGLAWLLPPLLLYLTYTTIWPREEQLHQRPHNIHAVAAICGPGLLWLLIARSSSEWRLIYPYTVFYAAQLAFIGVAYFREVYGKTANFSRIGICTVKGWLPLLTLYVLLQGIKPETVVNAFIAFAVILIATAVFNRLIPKPEEYSIQKFPWMRQAAVASIASIICLIPLYLI